MIVRRTPLSTRCRSGLSNGIADAERAAAFGDRLNLQIAVDYSSRDAITNAAARLRAEDASSRAAFGRLLAWPSCAGSTDVDLVVRSGGEERLSDFLLWEPAYAELCFVDTLWPDFGADDLRAAIDVVPGGAGQTTARCPAPVAIHDDGHCR
jgi:undecaprenyl diphosphate synthase